MSVANAIFVLLGVVLGVSLSLAFITVELVYPEDTHDPTAKYDAESHGAGGDTEL